jgi:YggT family protein
VSLVCAILKVYNFVLLGRILMSWFPVQPGTTMAQIAGILYELTEPVLGPVRRMMPRMGMFDLSPLIVVLGLQILTGSLQCSIGLF